MKRYQHYWWQVRGKYCPTRIVVADCDLAPAIAGISGQPSPERVTSWYAVADEYRGGNVVRTLTRCGEEVSALWHLLSSFVVSKETTWVIIPEACRVLAATGFWDMLDDGRARLVGKDWRVERWDGRSGEDKADGLCCIEDPPTLLLSAPAGAAGKWLILDSRNYGIEHERHETKAVDRAARIHQGIRQVVRTLREGVPVSLRGTAGAQAVQILRTRHGCVRLHCHTHRGALRLERAAYFGGRCEVYRHGRIEGPVYHLDIRSCYPSIGLTLPIPVSLREYTDESVRARELVEHCPDACCASVVLRAGAHRYPVRKDCGIAYPEGNIQTFLPGPELRAARDSSNIESVLAVARYTTAPYLREFFAWQLAAIERARARGEGLLVQALKRIGNALHGKFGEPGRRWVGTPAMVGMKDWTETTVVNADGTETRYRKLQGYVQRLETHPESYWSMPAVAAWITSAARLRLWHHIETAGGENVWYVDTDALITGQAGYDRLLRAGHIGAGAPGDLRLVGRYGECTIHGIRHYQFGNTVVCAGVPRGSIGPGETREDYWRRVPASTEVAMGRKPYFRFERRERE